MARGLLRLSLDMVIMAMDMVLDMVMDMAMVTMDIMERDLLMLSQLPLRAWIWLLWPWIWSWIWSWIWLWSPWILWKEIWLWTPWIWIWPWIWILWLDRNHHVVI